MQVQTAIRTYIISGVWVNMELKQEFPHHLNMSMGSSKEQWTETILLWDDKQSQLDNNLLTAAWAGLNLLFYSHNI